MPDLIDMRATWDAAARTGSDVVIGRPEFAGAQLTALFHDLGGEPHGGGVCVEIGCGTGRMTRELAAGWPTVIAVDISPAMLDRAREALVDLANVELRLVDGAGLDTVASRSAETVVCYGVLQHLPSKPIVARMLSEIARVLDDGGEAYVQLPVLEATLRARLWRLARAIRIRAGRGRAENVTEAPAYRGARVATRELDRALRAAGLRIVARSDRSGDAMLYSSYPHSTETRLRLAHADRSTAASASPAQ